MTKLGSRFRTASAAVLLAGVLACSVAATVTARRAPQPPSVDLGSVGRLATDAGSMAVDVTTTCPEGWSVVTARVTVTQPSGTGAAPFAVSCTGGYRVLTVDVPAQIGSFALGNAQATAELTIQRGKTQTARDAGSLTVEPTVHARLADTGRLVGTGTAVAIELTVACPSGTTGRESYVAVSQGGQAIGRAFFTPTCDGRARAMALTVQASQGAFTAGSAIGDAFVVIDYGGDAFFGVDDRVLTLASG